MKRRDDTCPFHIRTHSLCLPPLLNCNITGQYNHPRTIAHTARSNPTAVKMHLAEDATDIVRLETVSPKDVLRSSHPKTPQETVIRAIPWPTTSEIIQAQLTLAWASLLQRQRGEDDAVDQLSWGYVGDAKTTERLLLSVLGLKLSRTETSSISAALEALRAAISGASPTQVDSLCFIEEPQGPASQRAGPAVSVGV
jgi:hypothetical protein